MGFYFLLTDHLKRFPSGFFPHVVQSVISLSRTLNSFIDQVKMTILKTEELFFSLF